MDCALVFIVDDDEDVRDSIADVLTIRSLQTRVCILASDWGPFPPSAAADHGNLDRQHFPRRQRLNIALLNRSFESVFLGIPA
jgi:hypothetical protein